MGYSTLSAIKNAEYWNVYERDVRDERTEEIKKKIGWRTTVANKLDMLSYLQARHRDNEVLIRDDLLLKEMRGITRDSQGKVSLNGKDRVVAACIALQAAKQATLQQYEPIKQKEKGWY